MKIDPAELKNVKLVQSREYFKTYDGLLGLFIDLITVERRDAAQGHLPVTGAMFEKFGDALLDLLAEARTRVRET